MTSRPRIVVVGDTLLDIDISGTTDRISPDAPVPVVAQTDTVYRPGGAGLAAAVAAATADVTLVTALPDDDAAGRLRTALTEASVGIVAIPTTGATVVKQRVRANGQSVVRLDSGNATAASAPLPYELRQHISDLLCSADAILVSDYGRGMTSVPAIRALLESVCARTPVVWDPHPRGSDPIAGCRVITPNRSEAGVPVSSALASWREIGRRAAELASEWGSAAVCVTLGAQGALLAYPTGVPSVVVGESVTGLDTCGAGDQFASAFTHALAVGALIPEAAQQAVQAAGAFVAAGAAAGWRPAYSQASTITPRPSAGLRDWSAAAAFAQRVRARGGTVVATGGCFDLLHAGHVELLRSARAIGDCLIVALNSDSSVTALKGPDRPILPMEHRAQVLMALESVDHVVCFDERTPVRLLEHLRPDVWAKGGDYTGEDLPELHVLRQWDGQAVILPYVPGHSTSAVVDGIAQRYLLSNIGGKGSQ